LSVIREKALSAAALAGVALVIVLGVTLRLKRDSEEPSLALLEGPLRLTAQDPEVIPDLLLGLRVYHYRARPRGQQTLDDFFFDTPDWRLHDQRASLRLRIDTKPSGKQKYTVQLVALDTREDGSPEPIELLSASPIELNEDLISSKWDLQLVKNMGFDPEPFEEALRNLGIAVDDLALQLQGRLVRDRFHVTDKGRTWFELDYEHWIFRRPSAKTGSSEFAIHDLVIELRMHQGAADLTRRAKTMEEFVLSMYPIETTHLSPHDRAIIALQKR
jgi:hypothetical protein